MMAVPPGLAAAPLGLTIACLAAVLALLVAEWRGSLRGRVVAKMAASTGFVGVALALGALDTRYGQLILGALVLGWLGDAFLLSDAAKAFLAGLGAFLLSHLMFAAAFGSGALSWPAMGWAAAVALVFGAGVLRWLLPSTPAEMRVPVLAYVVVILAMCITAAGHAQASGRWAVMLGAVVFAASDIAVARERFVQPGLINRLWGLPAYFIAQLVLAWTVAQPPGAAAVPHGGAGRGDGVSAVASFADVVHVTNADRVAHVAHVGHVAPSAHFAPATRPAFGTGAHWPLR